MLCAFRTWGIKAFRYFLSILHLRKLYLFEVSPGYRSATHLHKLVRQFTVFHSLLPSIFPVSVRFSRPSFLSMCPRKFKCVFLILCISVLLVSTLLKTSQLFTLPVYGILNILPQKYIFVALRLCFNCRETVQYSLPYRRPAIL